MKLNSSFFISLGAAILFTACVHDEVPVFPDSASARMAQAMEAAQKVLVAEDNCWLMEYFPQKDQTYGGYVFFVKFTETEVTAWGEVSDNLAKSYTSLYTMTNDSGPVLSFDTFNYVLHYFATPSGSNMSNIYGQSNLYQGYEGDFEFLVLKASAEEVILKGKRSGCLIHLYPFDGDPVEYLQDTKASMTENFKATVQGSVFTISAFSGQIGGTDYKIEMDRDMRQLSFTKAGEEESVSIGYMYTPDGLKLYKPFESGNVSVTSLEWDKEKECARIQDILLENRMPDGWVAYDRYLGTYDLTYNDNEDWLVEPKTVTVTLEKLEEGSTYLMKGVSDKYDVTVKYDLAGGNLVIMGQIVGKFGDNSVYFAAMYASRSASGGATWTGWRSTSYGIKTKADSESLETDPDHFVMKFIPGPSAAGKGINSFGLLMQKPDGTSGGWMRPSDEDDHQYDDWFLFEDNYYALFWRDMVKK